MRSGRRLFQRVGRWAAEFGVGRMASSLGGESMAKRHIDWCPAAAFCSRLMQNERPSAFEGHTPFFDDHKPPQQPVSATLHAPSGLLQLTRLNYLTSFVFHALAISAQSMARIPL